MTDEMMEYKAAKDLALNRIVVLEFNYNSGWEIVAVDSNQMTPVTDLWIKLKKKDVSEEK